jgi:hypothetical protein
MVGSDEGRNSCMFGWHVTLTVFRCVGQPGYCSRSRLILAATWCSWQKTRVIHILMNQHILLYTCISDVFVT